MILEGLEEAVELTTMVANHTASLPAAPPLPPPHMPSQAAVRGTSHTTAICATPIAVQAPGGPWLGVARSMGATAIRGSRLR